MALSGYTSKCPVTIPSAQSPVVVGKYPIPLTGANVPAALFNATTGCKADGSDIRVCADINGVDVYPIEVISINKATNTLLVYFLYSNTLTAASNRTVYLFWGNPSAEFIVPAVWAAYYGVLSFAHPTGGDNGWKTAKDSAGRYNAGNEYVVGVPTMAAPLAGATAWDMDSASGKFCALNEQIKLEGSFYLEFWAHHRNVAPSVGSSNILAPVTYYAGVGTTGVGISTDGLLVLRDASIATPAVSPTWNMWNHFVVFRNAADGNKVYYIVNGVDVVPAGVVSTVVPEQLAWAMGSNATLVQYATSKLGMFALRYARLALPVPAGLTPANQTLAAKAAARSSYLSTKDSALITAGAVTTVTQQQTLSLTGLQPGSDIVIVRQNTSQQLVEVMANATAVYNHVYAYAANDVVDILIYKKGFVPYFVRGYTRGANDAVLPIAQTLDRNYQ